MSSLPYVKFLGPVLPLPYFSPTKVPGPRTEILVLKLGEAPTATTNSISVCLLFCEILYLEQCNLTEKSQMTILIDFKTVYKYKTLVLYFKSWRKISSH